MKFEKIKPGMTLYEVSSDRMGNTTLRTLGVRPVEVVSVDAVRRTAVCIWNHNSDRPRTYFERQLSKLKEHRPVLVRSASGGYRRERREERKDRLAKGKSAASAPAANGGEG